MKSIFENLRSDAVDGSERLLHADGKAILLPLDGDIYLATLNGAAKPIIRRLTDTPESELNPAVSPAGASAWPWSRTPSDVVCCDRARH